MVFDLVLNSQLALNANSQHFCFNSDGKKIGFYGERLYSEHRNVLGKTEHIGVYYLSDESKCLWIQNEKYGLCTTAQQALEFVRPTKKPIHQILNDLNLSKYKKAC